MVVVVGVDIIGIDIVTLVDGDTCISIVFDCCCTCWVCLCCVLQVAVLNSVFICRLCFVAVY